jgi:photosystem II stability/assembly factor-like uncharacterized protein
MVFLKQKLIYVNFFCNESIKLGLIIVNRFFEQFIVIVFMLKIHSLLAILFAGSIIFSSCTKRKCSDPQPESTKDTVIFKDLSRIVFPSLLISEFKTSDYGFVGGVSGFIAKTTDGGTNWTDVSPSTTGDIIGLSFFDQNLGFVGTNNGDAFKTIDGGAHWTKLTTPSSSNHYTDFIFFDANTILATGGNTSRVGVMMKSTDAGANWTDVSITGSSTIYDFEFLSKTVGFTCGTNNEIYKTTDGGSTWTAKTVNLTVTPTSLLLLGQLKFVDANTGYCVGFSSSQGENYILKTTDGGENWNQLTSPTQTTSTADVYTSLYLDKNKQPYIVGGNVANNTATLLTSTDGGTTWQHVTTPAIYRLTECTYINGIAYIVGLNGTIVKATDQTTTTL